MALGAAIGLSIGLGWSAIFGPATDGPPSLLLSFIVYSSGFTLTGVLVGFFEKVPPATGALLGLVILSVMAVIVGPKDGWIVLWLFAFGGSGLFWGFVIGAIYFAFVARR